MALHGVIRAMLGLLPQLSNQSKAMLGLLLQLSNQSQAHGGALGDSSEAPVLSERQLIWEHG